MTEEPEEICIRCIMEGKHSKATHHAKYDLDKAIEGLCDKHFAEVKE